MRGRGEFLQETHTCQDVTSHKIQFASVSEEGPCANCTHDTYEDSYGVPLSTKKRRSREDLSTVKIVDLTTKSVQGHVVAHIDTAGFGSGLAGLVGPIRHRICQLGIAKSVTLWRVTYQ